MSDTVDLSKVRIQFKRQLAVDTPASGTGGFGLEVLAGGGMQATAAQISSAMIKRNKMKRRSRRGPVKTTTSYETEIQPGVFEETGPAVLGAEDWTPEQVFTEAQLGSVTFADDGDVATATFGSGDPIALGMRVGLFLYFRLLTTTGNENQWIPIAGFSGSNNRIVALAPGYVTDETIDSDFEVVLCRYVATPAVYDDKVYTTEEYQGEDADYSKTLKNTRFSALVLTEVPGAFPKVSFGIAGRLLEKTTGGTGPIFTDATYPEDNSLILLDGGLYINRKKREDLTALTIGITAQVNSTDTIGTLDGPAAKVGEFEFSGSVSGVIESGDDFADFNDDADVAIQLHYKDRNSERGVGFYAGNMCYGGYGTPAGGEGDAIQQMPLYGGDDDHGIGHLKSVFVICDLTESPITLES